MGAFCSLVDQLADQCNVTLAFTFGLFGDALLDPLIVDRARYVKEKLPGIVLSLNSNAAAYSTAKHAVLADIVDHCAIHFIVRSGQTCMTSSCDRCALNEWRQRSMMILRDFGRKTVFGIPLHRLNVSERQTMTDYFLDRGAGSVNFTPISNRCSSNGLYEHLAFSPIHPECRSERLDDLIVDWDGLIIGCCNDFKRQEPIGDLRTMSLREVLDGSARRAFASKLDAVEWASLKTCSTCRWDKCAHVGVGVRSPLLEEEPTGPAAELRAVYASTSSRLTAPLRALRRALSR